MSSEDTVDPTVEEADGRAERAKASLLARVELLKQRVTEAKHKLDVPAQIARHPWPALGVAFALGVAAGLRRKGSVTLDESHGRRSVGDLVLAAAAAIGIRLVRDAAIGQLSELARAWIARSGGDLEPFHER